MKRSRYITLVVGLLLIGAAYGVATFVYGATHLHYRPDNLDLAFDVSPRGEQIVFTGAGNGKRDLYLLDLKTSRVTRLTNTPNYEGDPAFSPDGRFIAYVAGVPEKGSDRADHLYIRSLDGKTVKQLTHEDFNDSQPSFSPDGTQIVFLRADQYITGGLIAWGSWWNPQIFIIHGDGTQLRQITDSKRLLNSPKLSSWTKRTPPSWQSGFNEIEGFDIGSPQFSPDGKTLVFDIGDTRYGQLHEIASINLTKNIDNWSQGIQLLTHDGQSVLPTISHNGKQIALISDYWGRAGGAYNLFLTKNNGTGRKAVMNAGKLNAPKGMNIRDGIQTWRRAKFSPDGKFLYLLLHKETRDANSSSQMSVIGLWRADTKGKNLVQIADGTLFTNPLSWKPTQKQ